MSESYWYNFLKEIIKSENWLFGMTDYAFRQGEVSFARVAGLITKEQADELNDMIPEY